MQPLAGRVSGRRRRVGLVIMAAAALIVSALLTLPVPVAAVGQLPADRGETTVAAPDVSPAALGAPAG